jgi:UDP-GlcNAc:undecaprenyl-phosphate GlcNAc-1-phosphate transferase
MASIGLEAWDYDFSLLIIPILLITLSLFTAYLARMKVVSTEQPDRSGFSRFILNLTFKRRIFELIFDLLLISVSYYIAFWTYYGLNMTVLSMQLFSISWPIALGISYMSFYLFGVYRGVWRYIGINDLVRYVGASAIAGGISWVIINELFSEQQFSGGIFLLFSIYLLIGLAGSRSSFLYLDRIYSTQFRGVEKQNVLLYGAEDAGEIALRWILRNPSLGYNVVGFLDRDSNKWGNNIHGISILGDIDKISQYIQDKRVSGIIVTSENILMTEAGERFKNECRLMGVWVRVLRLEFELTD